jgi:hypothetical protein
LDGNSMAAQFFGARQHAVFLARNIDKLVEEEITQHKRGRECCEENRKPLIRNRSRLLIEATIRPFSRGWSITGMLFRHGCASFAFKADI